MTMDAWFLRTNSRPDIHTLASCYLGPLVFILALFNVYTLKPLSAVVMVYGSFETMLLLTRNPQRIPPALLILSIIGHIMVYIPYMGKNTSAVQFWLSLAALLFVAFRHCIRLCYASAYWWPPAFSGQALCDGSWLPR